MQIDTVIRGGLVIDGTGDPPRLMDLGLTADRIVAMEPPGILNSDEVIDVAGYWVCPGFIDTHTHSDTYLLLEPDSPSKITQGITTEVTGNCGSSAAPLYGIRRLPSDWQAKTYPVEWQSLAEYRTHLTDSPCAVNIVALIGHNTLRASVMGSAARPAEPDEIRAMVKMLRDSLSEGAWGWTTGLLYTPGKWAEAAELQALSRAAADVGAIYATHLRNEGDHLLEALDETLQLALETGALVQISHLKVTGKAGPEDAQRVLERLQTARDKGVIVAADKYPYDASCTDLDVVLPDEAIREGHTGTLRRLRSPAMRRQLIEHLATSRDAAYWERITVASCFHPETHRYQGMPLTQVAESLKQSPIEALLTLIERDELKTSAFFFNMPPSPNRQLFEDEHVMLGSDASLRAPWGILGREFPHPRAYGTFPRFFRLAIDELGWTPERAIHRMTGLPAGHFGLVRRGVLRPGNYADILALDPVRFRDRATYAVPQQFAEGIDQLWINGIRVMADGNRTGLRPGRWLERA